MWTSDELERALLRPLARCLATTLEDLGLELAEVEATAEEVEPERPASEAPTARSMRDVGTVEEDVPAPETPEVRFVSDLGPMEEQTDAHAAQGLEIPLAGIAGPPGMASAGDRVKGCETDSGPASDGGSPSRTRIRFRAVPRTVGATGDKVVGNGRSAEGRVPAVGRRDDEGAAHEMPQPHDGAQRAQRDARAGQAPVQGRPAAPGAETMSPPHRAPQSPEFSRVPTSRSAAAQPRAEGHTRIRLRGAMPLTAQGPGVSGPFLTGRDGARGVRDEPQLSTARRTVTNTTASPGRPKAGSAVAATTGGPSLAVEFAPVAPSGPEVPQQTPSAEWAPLSPPASPVAVEPKPQMKLEGHVRLVRAESRSHVSEAALPSEMASFAGGSMEPAPMDGGTVPPAGAGTTVFSGGAVTRSAPMVMSSLTPRLASSVLEGAPRIAQPEAEGAAFAEPDLERLLTAVLLQAARRQGIDV